MVKAPGKTNSSDELLLTPTREKKTINMFLSKWLDLSHELAFPARLKTNWQNPSVQIQALPGEAVMGECCETSNRVAGEWTHLGSVWGWL